MSILIPITAVILLAILLWYIKAEDALFDHYSAGIRGSHPKSKRRFCTACRADRKAKR